jgi:hypothetical protein
MSWPLEETPEARLRTKLRTLPSLRHMCMACDSEDIRALLELLECEREKVATLRVALVVMARTAASEMAND